MFREIKRRFTSLKCRRKERKKLLETEKAVWPSIRNYKKTIKFIIKKTKEKGLNLSFVQ